MVPFYYAATAKPNLKLRCNLNPIINSNKTLNVHLYHSYRMFIYIIPIVCLFISFLSYVHIYHSYRIENCFYRINRYGVYTIQTISVF